MHPSTPQLDTFTQHIQETTDGEEPGGENGNIKPNISVFVEKGETSAQDPPTAPYPTIEVLPNALWPGEGMGISEAYLVVTEEEEEGVGEDASTPTTSPSQSQMYIVVPEGVNQNPHLYIVVGGDAATHTQ